ncbi:MAG: hypothetical protein HQK75_06765 [Candidatus Magnetomorum sp.]|nr:hypothetical protein [Candidatus Magnetomorum sp.]
MRNYQKHTQTVKKYWPFRAFTYLALLIISLIVFAGISSAMSTSDTTLIGGFCHAAYHTKLLMP